MSSESKKSILRNLNIESRGGQTYSSPDFHFLKVPDKTLIETFQEKITTVKGQFIPCSDISDFKKKIESLISNRSFKNISCCEPEIRNIFPDNIITNEIISEETDLAITGCEFLSAQTGSVIVSTNHTKSRRTFSFAPVHIVVSFENQLVAEFDNVFQNLYDKYGGKLPAQITVITGPSRTADIEKTLVLGAHGPKELIVFLIKD